MNTDDRCRVEAARVSLSEMFDRLEAHGCNPRWLPDGSILADCPSCGGKDDLIVTPASAEAHG